MTDGHALGAASASRKYLHGGSGRRRLTRLPENGRGRAPGTRRELNVFRRLIRSWPSATSIPLSEGHTSGTTNAPEMGLFGDPLSDTLPVFVMPVSGGYGVWIGAPGLLELSGVIVNNSISGTFDAYSGDLLGDLADSACHRHTDLAGHGAWASLRESATALLARNRGVVERGGALRAERRRRIRRLSQLP